MMKDLESKNGKALVIGGSLAGLLAARVLSDFYNEVTIIERDSLDTEDHRRGVPQSRHAHGLLAGGLQIIEELLPGITDSMVKRERYRRTLQTTEGGFSKAAA